MKLNMQEKQQHMLKLHGVAHQKWDFAAEIYCVFFSFKCIRAASQLMTDDVITKGGSCVTAKMV